MMNKKAATNGSDFMLGIIIGLVILVISIPFIVTFVVKPSESVNQCETTHHGRCTHQDEGCHVSEIKAPWSCKYDKEYPGGICCIGQDPYNSTGSTLGGSGEVETEMSIEEVVVPQTGMCVSGDKGLKCEDVAADNYCKALGYEGYYGGSKDCHCVDGTSCKMGSWANNETKPLKGSCGEHGSNLWIQTMKCYKHVPVGSGGVGGAGTVQVININFQGVPAQPILTLESGTEYTFEVESPDVGNEGKCTIYIKDPDTGEPIPGLTFPKVDCIGKKYEIKYTPDEYESTKTLHFDVIILIGDDLERVASSKTYLTITGSDEGGDGEEEPTTLPETLEAGTDCLPGAGVFSFNYDSTENSMQLQTSFIETTCYYKEIDLDASCFNVVLDKLVDCIQYEVHEPYKICAAGRYTNPLSGEEECFYDYEERAFNPGIGIYPSESLDSFFFVCSDGEVCSQYTFKYSFISSGTTCDAGAHPNAGWDIGEDHESDPIPGVHTGEKLCLKTSFKGGEAYDSSMLPALPET